MFDGIFRRRNLPHWDMPDATYFVTACLADSIPARGLKEADSLLHFHGQRYESVCYVVMPSHIHWVFRPREVWWEAAKATSKQAIPRESIMQSIKGYTAHECNRLLQRSGAFWQQESYDHVVRSDAELERIIYYVLNNPVMAGLVERPEQWRWSSAHRP